MALRTARTLFALLCAISTCGPTWAQVENVRASREVFGKAVEAYHEKDYKSYLQLMEHLARVKSSKRLRQVS